MASTGSNQNGPYSNHGQHRARRHPEHMERRVREGQKPSVPRNTYSSAGPRPAAGMPDRTAGEGGYRFTSEPVRHGRPVTSNRSADGRRPQVPAVQTNGKKQAMTAREAEKARKKAAQTTAVAAYRQRQLERDNKREAAWQKDIVRVRGGMDKVMLGLILTLVCLGTIMVFSASYPWAINEGKEMLYYGKRQILFVTVGLIAMFLAAFVPYTWYKKWGAIALYSVAILLLILVLVVGVSEGEAKRWLDLKVFTVQPSEIMKFALVMILAWYIDRFRPEIDARLNRKHTILYNVVGPGIFIGAACVLILLEKHLSGTAITGILGVAIMLVGGCHFGWTALFIGSAGLLAGVAFIIANPYALKRLTTFIDENADIMDALYQTTQGLYAIGSGGLFGVGLGQSRQKYSFVTYAHTDFIFSIWCEEMGFLGAVFLVLLFLAFVLRGYTIASRAPDTFSSLLAYGISTHVGLQALLNMSVVLDIIPNTGVPLPFFSYGGSSLIVLLGEMGVLLSISRQYYMKRKDLEAQERQGLLERK